MLEMNCRSLEKIFKALNSQVNFKTGASRTRAGRESRLVHSVAAAVLFALMILVGFDAAGEALPGGYTETEIKAAFVARLPQFIQWPDNRRAKRFCFTEPSTLSETMERLFKENPEGREILTGVQVKKQSHCDVLFVSKVMKEDSPAGGVLTMSDFPGSIEKGGMIELRRDGQRILLVINRRSLESAGLKASSKLLSLAKFHDADSDD